MTAAGAGEPSSPRCPREGRRGAGAPVAHASSRVLGSRRRGFPRVAVLRLAPLRCARSTRPPLGPLCDLGLRRRSAPYRHPDAVPPHSRAGEGPHMPLRGRVSDSEGLSPRLSTPGRVRP
nr:MAG TPA: hypothetical protein [Caudoviricetes sp.]